MADAPLFELEHVSFRYPGGEVALEDLSFSVWPGERVAILGSNGCGKSTLLKLLNGLLLPTSGALRIGGQVASAAAFQDEGFTRAFRQRVGFVFQRADIQLFTPTVWDEIAFGPLQLGMGPGETAARVRDVVSMLGLEGLRDRPPFRLSGGEQKKVAIAAVLALNPQALLLDEPTAALDPRTQRWLIELLQELAAAGKTLLIATHDLDVAPLLVNRALVLGEDHRLLRDGPGAEILADHSLLHTAALAHHHYPGPVHGAHQHEA